MASPPAYNTNGPYQPFDLGYKFNAGMAVIVVILVTVFFFMTLIVLYVRRCNLASVADLGWATGYNPHLAGVQQQQQQQSQQQQPNRRGVTPETLAKIPILRYSSIKNSSKKGKAGSECVVCLLQYEDAEEVRVLPACGHAFHTECIDMWLETHSTCPLCRRSINSESDGLQRTLSAVIRSLRREDPVARTLASEFEEGEPEQQQQQQQQQQGSHVQPQQDEQEAVSRTLSKNSESFRLAEHELDLMEVREKLRAASRRVQSSRSMRFTNAMLPAHQEQESGSPSSSSAGGAQASPQASPALRRSASDGESLRIWMGSGAEQQEEQRPRASSWSLNKSFRSLKTIKWLPN